MANVQKPQQNREIETDRFLIRGNLLAWDNIMLQFSNISAVGMGDMPSEPFPKISLVAGLGGLLALTMRGAGIFIGLALLVAAGWMIYNWYSENQSRNNKKYLHIQMNSGDIYSLLFHDTSFLKETLTVIKCLFVDPDWYGDQTFNFDLSYRAIKVGQQVIHANDLNIDQINAKKMDVHERG